LVKVLTNLINHILKQMYWHRVKFHGGKWKFWTSPMEKCQCLYDTSIEEIEDVTLFTLQTSCTVFFHGEWYCNVLGVLYSRWNFIVLQKVNTLQLNTVRNSSNTRTRPTCTVPEHSLLYNSSNRTSCGNLPTLTPILAVR
jgi:hypothetical protein